MLMFACMRPRSLSRWAVLAEALASFRRCRFLSVSVVFGICLVTLLWPAESRAQSRIGLVIGVSEYTTGSRLDQAVVDAKRVHNALVEVGFDMLPMLESPPKDKLQQALLEFSRRARGADVAMLYFAGHGMQYGEDNWIIPSDATLRHEDEIVLEGFSMQNLVRIMSQAKMRILILDACRNNPFAANWIVQRTNTNGLASIPEAQLPLGTLVGYSAAANQKTPDDSVYATALSEVILEEGVELRQAMDRVRRQVRKHTPDAEPEYIPRYEGSFSFRPGTVVAEAPTPTPTVITRIVVTNALTRSGVALIKEAETFSPVPYEDDFGYCSIGFGHLIAKTPCEQAALGEFANGIDERAAHNQLLLDLETAVEVVRSSVHVKLTQGQFNALVSFVFNIGGENFRNSTFLRIVNTGDHEAAARQFDRWIKSGGVVRPGLVIRREKERSMYEGDFLESPQ
jgi:GH24 family phage-related lysozyme (muramidase)